MRTMELGSASPKCELSIGMGHIPWDALGEGRQLTVIILGRSVHVY